MISELLKRDLSTVARRMKQLRTRREPSNTGRARSLSAMDEKKIVRTAERMIEYANGEWQVTAEMVKKTLKLKCCVRVVLSMSRRLCENVRFFDDRCRGPLFFRTWTVVDRKSRFRGPLFFHTWTVVDRSF